LLLFTMIISEFRRWLDFARQWREIAEWIDKERAP